MGQPKRIPRTTDKRSAILTAALDLFSERGFHGTPVPLVAERAGVGTGTVYRYFPSKEALVNALYQLWKSQLMQAVLEEFPTDAPPRKQFHAFWGRMIDFARTHPKEFSFLELHHHAPYLDADSLRIEETALAITRTFIERAQKHGVMVTVSPEVQMALVHGALVGLIKAEQHGWLKLNAASAAMAENALWDAVRK